MNDGKKQSIFYLLLFTKTYLKGWRCAQVAGARADAAVQHAVAKVAGGVAHHLSHLLKVVCVCVCVCIYMFG